MPTPQRQPQPGVIARLQARPQRFTFAQAINLLLATLARQGIGYEQAFRDIFRFRNSLSLAFPPSEIEALAIERRDGEDAGPILKIRLTPAFIGLLGSTGTLPLHDSERLAAQQYLEHDGSQHALVDLFSNRMVGLSYEAWGKYRVAHSLQVQGRDRLLPMLLALAGRSGGASAALAHPAAYYAGIVRTRPVSASAIERVLADHFAIPIRLEQLVGCWDAIPPARRSSFGRNNPVLGRGAVLGTRLWRHDLRVRLHLGPLDEAQLAQFLPGGAARAALADMVALFAAPMIVWEIRLHLASPCIARLRLSAAQAPRKLGWNSFLTSTAGVAPRAHVSSMLRPKPSIN